MRIACLGGISLALLATGTGACSSGSGSGRLADGGAFGIGNMAGGDGSTAGKSDAAATGGDGGDTSGGACPGFTSSTACGACELEACCSQITTCSADATCDACLSSGATTCTQNAAFNAAALCVQAQCATACTGSGLVGDVCTTDSDCASGICAATSTGVALWCTDLCTTSLGCGSSTAGVANICAMTASGQSACFPTCTTTTQCQAFGLGATCITGADVEGATVKACTGN